MHVEEESNSKNDEFLPELRHQFEQYLALRASLDTKATNSITMSSAIVTLLVAIGTFLVTKLDTNQPIFMPIAIVLVLSILFDIGGIILFIKSYIIKGYRYPMGHKPFFDNNNYKKDMADKFIAYSKERFRNHLIQEYLESIKQNGKSNESKANSIKYGQYLFLASISCIVGILLTAIIFVLLGQKILLT